MVIHKWKGDCLADYPATLLLKSLGVHRDGKASMVVRLRNTQSVFIGKQPKHWMLNKPLDEKAHL